MRSKRRKMEGIKLRSGWGEVVMMLSGGDDAKWWWYMK